MSKNTDSDQVVVVKTSELTGAALDWAVAQCLHLPIDCFSDDKSVVIVDGSPFMPSFDWDRAGPIIENENIEWQWLPSSHEDHKYGARKPSLGGIQPTFCKDGPSILIAAMRCFVASKIGNDVVLPKELS